MLCQGLIFCFLCFVTEIITTKVFLINLDNEKQLKLLSDEFKKFLIRPIRDELRSEYEFKSLQNICNRHFGSIFGAKAQKLFCLENYKERKLRKEPYKRRKEIKQPKQFIDMTRGVGSKFSSDYVDFKDNRYIDEFSNDYFDVGDLVRHDNGARRTWPYETKHHKIKGRFRADDSDTSSEEDSDNNPNRFQIIDNQSSESDSGSSESGSGSRESKKEVKKEAKSIYFQGRNRYVKDYDGRKRLEHFMPKRYHWDDRDIKKLGYYWFNGPRGRFPEAVNLS